MTLPTNTALPPVQSTTSATVQVKAAETITERKSPITAFTTTICLHSVRQLMQVYQGEFVDSRHEGYRKLDKLLQLKLRYADFRNPERCVFLFDSHILEGGVTLCYCPEDLYVIDNAHVVTAQTDTLRLEGLGIDGSGYTLCVRVCENWFYVESLLPT